MDASGLTHAALTTVTCVIALHREGVLAHTTLTSIAKAREVAEQHRLSVEFVITLDCHDKFTEQIVRQHPAVRNTDTIEVVTYGDLGASRNHAIARASGDYVVCMDGDDYYSSNYIAVAVREAKTSDHVIIYPEYTFSFEREHACVRNTDSNGEPFNPYSLFSSHYFSSSLTARRKTFLQIPFCACPSGFGFEDWHWNCEAVAKGFWHRPAPGTVLFYRRKAESMCRSYAANAAIIPPSHFFDMLPAPEPIAEGSHPTDSSTVPHVSIDCKALVKSAVFTALRALPTKWGNRLYSVIRRWQQSRKKNVNVLEPLIYSALLEVAKIDGLLHPDRLPKVTKITPKSDEAPGRAYAAAWHSLTTHEYDIVFTAPHIGIGGADLMTINYIRAVHADGKRALCITTDGRPSTPAALPRDVQLLDLGSSIAHLPLEGQRMVLTRLLVQLAPKLIHAVNDWLSFQCISCHGAALRHASQIVVSIFADAQDDNGIFYGAGTDNLRAIYPYVERVVTDNRVVADNWEKQFGFPQNFFYSVYGVVPEPVATPSAPSVRNRVLWAGRLDTEKRLDIAYKIMKGSPEIYFDIYGAPVLDKKPDPSIVALQKLPNVRLCGKYDGFASLPVENYFAFLYTTQCDGLPNVLLEAVSTGLPVVAPDRGGIRDFVTNATGWLIPNHTDVLGYVKALQEIQAQPQEACRRWECARALLQRRHNVQVFSSSLFEAYRKEDSICRF